jgi:PAS domain S-box-containing protein
MRAIAAPNLPESYIAALDGFVVGPQGGSCGAAVNQRKPVFVSDVLTDPILEQVRDIIAAHGIRACWSAPILSHQGEILGTFAFYFRSVRSPSPRDIHLIENATSIAGIAIERKKAEENLRRSEWSLLEAQRLGHSGSWSLDVSSGIVTTSPEMLRSFDVKPGDDCSSPDFWFNRIHPEDRKRIRDLFERCVVEKTDYEAHYRLLLPDGTIKYQHSIGRPIVNKKGDLVEFVGTAIDVTEQAQAEEKLRRSEADLLEGQRLTHTLTWRYDVSSRRVTNTPEANRIYGFKGDEDTSDPELYFEMIHPDDRKRVRELFERCTVLKINYEADYAIILPDGNIRHIHATGHPVLNESGDLVEWVGTTMDVTEQAQARIELEKAFEEIKQRTEAARRSERELRDVVNTVPAHVWSTSPDGQVDFVNDRWLQFTGLALDEAFGGKWEAVLHPDDRTRVVADWHTAVKNRQAMESEARVRRADGEYCWWFIRNVPLRDENGKLVGWYGTAIDIEDRKRAEQALRKSEAYLAEAHRLAKTGSWAYSPAAEKCIYWSDEMRRIFGLNPQRSKLPDRDEFLRLVHPEDRDRFNEGIEKSRREKSDFVQDYRIVLTDGTVKHIHGIGHPVLDETGNIIEYVGTDVDVTEHKRAEEKLRRSEADLLEAQRISHTGSWRHDIASGAVLVSPEMYRIFDIKRDDDTSNMELFYSRLPPEDRKRVVDLFKRAEIEKKTDYQVDYRIVLPDGTIKHLHTIGHPVLNESGELLEYVGTTMDVTEQAQARIELEKAFEEIKRLKDRLHDENLALREQIDQAFMFEEIVGASPALQTVLSSIVKVAPTDSTVLITGETGTGKELIARAIHKHSQRSGQAFISVNCASIPSSLIASELFGHEKGAFTGAVQRRQGRFELAHSGTIFLDEVGDLPAETQIALLRVLQERQFERVGGNRILPTDVRVIAATNRDLTAAIAAGTFRADLFYRLNVFPIEVPPLRKRKEDIPMLVEYFVKRYAEKAGKQIRKIDRNTLEQCQSYPWPGNIRELQNIVERSVILSSGDTFWIEKAWLASQEATRQELPGPLPDTLQKQERKIIEMALAESKGKVAGPEGAAAKLGIPRSTLDTKIKQLGIKKHRFIAK